VFVPLHDTNPLNMIRFQVVTVSLMVINIALYTVTYFELLGGSEAETIYTYGVIPAELIGGTNKYDLAVPLMEEFTLGTYMFLHAGWMHLLGNMLFLWVFGDNVEDALGHTRFLLFFILCGIASALAHTFIDTGSEIPLVGASGAIAGVLGAYIVLYPRARVWVLLLLRIPVRLPAIWVLGAWIAFQFVSLSLIADESQPVAWWAHIGGFAAGLLLVYPMRKHDVSLEQT
jgi:membrane associated rhomboid family serine protease